MRADELRALADAAEEASRFLQPQVLNWPFAVAEFSATMSPDAARLLADMADHIAIGGHIPGVTCEPIEHCYVCALLARFAGLGAPQQEETP